jgi:hypothetical protein
LEAHPTREQAHGSSDCRVQEGGMAVAPTSTMDFPALRRLARQAGTPLDGEDLARVAALLDDDDARPSPDPTGHPEPDGDRELESYRVGATAVGAFRVAGEYVVATRELFPASHAGEQAKQKLASLNQMADQHDLVPFTAEDLDPWELDGEVRTTAVHGGYAQAAQACQDGRRRLLGLLLAPAVLRRVAGWEADAVVLGRGYDYYLLRTRREGTIELACAEQPMEAYALFAGLVADLAEELVPPHGSHRLGRVSPLLPATVRAWLYREAGEALGDQARVTAGVGLAGLVKAGDLARSARQPARMSLAELACSLHTDRARLARAISAGTN